METVQSGRGMLVDNERQLSKTTLCFQSFFSPVLISNKYIITTQTKSLIYILDKIAILK